ncbi:hypothetical protein [Azotobacter armeniacus]
MPGFNLATISPAERAAISASRAECLNRYKRALDLANLIYSQRRDKGNGWQSWAKLEIAKHPELEIEVRAKLNRLMRGQSRD